jgi:GNAT superfamily N-acetyltransferase
MAAADQLALDEPGICGVIGSPDHPRGRLLITDDRAAARLERLLPQLHVQIVNVFAEATRCRDLIEQLGSWRGEDVTAMVCPDLASMSTVAAPSGLTIRAVRRVTADPEGGVPLEQAAQACLQADPDTADQPLPGFIAFLQSLPASTRLLAAVDKDNVVRATAGSSTLGTDANAYFVSTDVQWRNQGVATSMTAAALAWACQRGARAAALDASPAGLSIYLRLGFEPVSPSTLFAQFG